MKEKDKFFCYIIMMNGKTTSFEKPFSNANSLQITVKCHSNDVNAIKNNDDAFACR